MITTRNNTIFKYQTTLVDNREDKHQSYTTMTQIVLKVTESTKNSSLLVSEFPIFFIEIHQIYGTEHFEHGKILSRHVNRSNIIQNYAIWLPL